MIMKGRCGSGARRRVLLHVFKKSFLFMCVNNLPKVSTRKPNGREPFSRRTFGVDFFYLVDRNRFSRYWKNDHKMRGYHSACDVYPSFVTMYKYG